MDALSTVRLPGLRLWDREGCADLVTLTVGPGMRRSKRSGGASVHWSLDPGFALLVARHFWVGHEWALNRFPCRTPAARGQETMSRRG